MERHKGGVRDFVYIFTFCVPKRRASDANYESFQASLAMKN